MLGGALEGVMLGSLQRSDVIDALSNGQLSAPNCIQSLGLQNPNLSELIANELGFEDFKVSINHLIPSSKDIGVDNIQAFRNAIHPWKALKAPTKYQNFDQARAIHYIGSFKKIAEVLVSWTP